MDVVLFKVVPAEYYAIPINSFFIDVVEMGDKVLGVSFACELEAQVIHDETKMLCLLLCARIDQGCILREHILPARDVLQVYCMLIGLLVENHT